MLTTEQLDEVSVIEKDSFKNKILERERAKIHEQFMLLVNPQKSDLILDVGASANPAFKCSNYLESACPNLNITALGLGEINSIWEKLYPNIPYIHGDALSLPFEDNSFDIVYSHAVIEHVGSLKNQAKMLREVIRVARKSVWITTPYRWHPIEFHTLLPFIHWLPKSAHRFLLKNFGKKYFASEETLNLLDKKCLIYLIEEYATKSEKQNLFGLFKSKIHFSKFMGFTGNLLLHIILAKKP